jgi:hypothetical protein
MMPEKEPPSEKDFPNWNNLYSSQKVETMPWHIEDLDSNLEEELEKRKISNKVMQPILPLERVYLQTSVADD